MENQKNGLTGNVYEGRNQSDLRIIKATQEYKSDEWVTFLQAKELGLKVKKGSKAVTIFKGFAKGTEVNAKGKLIEKSYPIGFARVFNLDQTEKFEK